MGNELKQQFWRHFNKISQPAIKIVCAHWWCPYSSLSLLFSLFLLFTSFTQRSPFLSFDYQHFTAEITPVKSWVQRSDAIPHWKPYCRYGTYYKNYFWQYFELMLKHYLQKRLCFCPFQRAEECHPPRERRKKSFDNFVTEVLSSIGGDFDSCQSSRHEKKLPGFYKDYYRVEIGNKNGGSVFIQRKPRREEF